VLIAEWRDWIGWPQLGVYLPNPIEQTKAALMFKAFQAPKARDATQN
jgi:hypothetical protein